MSEIYTGVKFQVVHGTEEPVQDPRVNELIGIGKRLADRGFCPENSGNLSFRAATGFVITAAGSELGKLKAGSFVWVQAVDIPQKKVFCAGKAPPSSEAMMHQMIYDARPDAAVILHAHALDLKNAPVTEREFPYGTVEFARSAVEVLKDHDLVILKNHGFVALGKTVSEVYERLALG
jgi:ribulose-5-phosphate 4-epimerase/fuculose-1-phosphate aldolase